MTAEEAWGDKASGKGQVRQAESRHWFCCILLTSGRQEASWPLSFSGDKWLVLYMGVNGIWMQWVWISSTGLWAMSWSCSWSAYSIDTLGNHPGKLMGREKDGRRYAALYWRLLRENDRKRLSTEMKGMLVGRNWKKSHYLNSVVWMSQVVTQSEGLKILVSVTVYSVYGML